MGVGQWSRKITHPQSGFLKPSFYSPSLKALCAKSKKYSSPRDGVKGPKNGQKWDLKLLKKNILFIKFIYTGCF